MARRVAGQFATRPWTVVRPVRAGPGQRPDSLRPLAGPRLTRTPALRLVVLLSALVAVFAAGVGSGVGSLGRIHTPQAVDALPTPVTPGDRVVATGLVVANEDGTLQLCLPGPARLVDDGRPPACSSLSTPLRGLSASMIPGWVSTDGTGYARGVTVFGIWTGDGIDAERAVGGIDPATPEPIECPGPVSGPPAAPGDLREEAALAALADEVFGNREVYGGFWRSRLGHIVVGVAGDPADREDRVRQRYPYALCLVRVPNSLAVLDAAATDLGGRVASWQWVVDPATNRVRVTVLVVDEATAALAASHEGQIAFDPLVRSDRR